MILLLRTAQLKVLVLFDRNPQNWNPQNCLLLWGIQAPSSNWFTWPKSPQPKRHLDRFIRFCRARGCYQQTDRQTYKSRHSACRNRLSNKQRFCQNYRNQLILAQVAAENNVWDPFWDTVYTNSGATKHIRHGCDVKTRIDTMTDAFEREKNTQSLTLLIFNY